ncbi:hypothetical protein PUN28_006046 [Cardiocondyla obscurior]|uniref:Uncharacterized protein n=1 Tax=Cardiocondyla obscurior TaxID=286306 RepID=A0AAW2GCY4_9HYME
MNTIYSVVAVEEAPRYSSFYILGTLSLAQGSLLLTQFRSSVTRPLSGITVSNRVMEKLFFSFFIFFSIFFSSFFFYDLEHRLERHSWMHPWLRKRVNLISSPRVIIPGAKPAPDAFRRFEIRYTRSFVY